MEWVPFGRATGPANFSEIHGKALRGGLEIAVDEGQDNRVRKIIPAASNVAGQPIAPRYSFVSEQQSRDQSGSALRWRPWQG